MNKRKHWLITGGTGFIGREVVRSRRKIGDRVTVLSRSPITARKLLGCSVVSDLNQIDVKEKIDVVLNLAGESLMGGPWTDARVRRFFTSRIGTTEQLSHLIKRQIEKPSVFISGSAIGYYGTSIQEPLDETATAGSDMMAQLCEQWEQASDAIASHGVRTVKLRTGLVLDADGGMLQPLALAARFGLLAVLGNGEHGQSWISRYDLVRLITFLVDNESFSGPVNGTAPEPISQRVFVDTLSAHFKRPRFLRLPAPFLRLPMGQLATLFLEGQYVLPRAALDKGFKFYYPDLSSALKAIYHYR